MEILRCVFIHSGNYKEKKRERRFNGGNGSVQSFIPTNDEIFLVLVVKSFIGAEIPLYKLRNTHLKGLFIHMKFMLPSETSVRLYIKEKLYNEVVESIKSELKDKQLYLQVDEIFMYNRNFFVLIGPIDQPDICLCVSVEIVPIVNHLIVKHIITSVFFKYKLEETKPFLFLSDSDSYTKRSVLSLRTIFTNCSFVFCKVHILQNFCAKLKDFHPQVDSPIVRIKSITCMNKTNREILIEVGVIPYVIITRYGSWLEASLWYAQNLEGVKYKVKELKGGKLILKEKE